MAQIMFNTDEDKATLAAIVEMIETLTGGKPAKYLPPQAADLSEQGLSLSASSSPEHQQTEQGTVGTVQPDAADAADATAAQVDCKGVPFNPDYCANAKEPFYASGPRSGQWKKRKGVDEGDYDDWYTDALADNTTDVNTEGNDVNTAEAFKSDCTPPAADTPTTFNAFMGYVAELQTSGRITSDQIGLAYTSAGVAVTDLLPPNPPEVVAGHISRLCASLQAAL